MRNVEWRWLLPGTGVKRWLALVILGLAIMMAGLFLSLGDAAQNLIQQTSASLIKSVADTMPGENPMRSARIAVGATFILAGLALAWFSTLRLWHAFVRVLNPRSPGKPSEIMARHGLIAQGKRIVALGGGTGMSTLLRGLKRHTANISAIVTVTDDGGSSGKLREELNVLPPGDIRNCLVALADVEPTMTALLQFRFDAGSTHLAGHSFGNLLIAAMTQITGDFDLAVQEIGKVLAIRGRVLPTTVDHVTLRAEMEDGAFVEGETRIVADPRKIRRMYLNPPDAKAVDQAVKAIRQSDLVVIGPGSLFTSVIPNLLVQGVADALASSDAIRVYVCNVMTQPGETDNLTASDHARTIEAHAGKRVFDYVLMNSAQPSQQILQKYEDVGQRLVVADQDRVRSMGWRPIAGNFISESDLVRHDPLRVSEALLRLAR